MAGFATYAAQVREQEGRVEMITDLGGMLHMLETSSSLICVLVDMVKTHLKNWMKGEKGAKPDNIIFFRDGQAWPLPVLQMSDILTAVFRKVSLAKLSITRLLLSKLLAARSILSTVRNSPMS